MQNNEEHEKNEGPIYLAFLHVLAFREAAKGSSEYFDFTMFWCHLVDLLIPFWHPLDFEVVPKVSMFEEINIK